MIKRNYQKELDKLLESQAGLDKKPVLLLHSCCAPCSSYVMEYLKKHFQIVLYFYNPNISSAEEYTKRLEEIRRLVGIYNETLEGDDIILLEGEYEPSRFYETAKGLENEPEGGKRCEACFRLRLSESRERALEQDADYITTTLTISPLKNAELLNTIGEELTDADEKLNWLPSDFKKKDGYKRSIELSREFDLYRQNFCGCVYSRKEAK